MLNCQIKIIERKNLAKQNPNSINLQNTNTGHNNQNFVPPAPPSYPNYQENTPTLPKYQQ